MTRRRFRSLLLVPFLTALLVGTSTVGAQAAGTTVSGTLSTYNSWVNYATIRTTTLSSIHLQPSNLLVTADNSAVLNARVLDDTTNTVVGGPVNWTKSYSYKLLMNTSVGYKFRLSACCRETSDNSWSGYLTY